MPCCPAKFRTAAGGTTAMLFVPFRGTLALRYSLLKLQACSEKQKPHLIIELQSHSHLITIQDCRICTFQMVPLVLVWGGTPPVSNITKRRNRSVFNS